LKNLGKIRGKELSNFKSVALFIMNRMPDAGYKSIVYMLMLVTLRTHYDLVKCLITYFIYPYLAEL
jgi:hypothetical protein